MTKRRRRGFVDPYPMRIKTWYDCEHIRRQRAQELGRAWGEDAIERLRVLIEKT